MNKFRFRLEAVERHKEMREQDKRIALSKSLQSLRSVERALNELGDREVKARKEFANLGSPEHAVKINSGTFWILDQFIQGQKYRRQELQNVLQQKEGEVAHCYREFLHARQQKKIMEKLRERREEDYKEKLRKHDNRSMDELYTMRHRLGKGEDDEQE